MSDRFDVIVIGAGNNGLAAACYLQRAGLRTVVLEQRPDDVVGGGATTEEITLPGFKHNVGANWMAGIQVSGVCEELELDRQGLAFYNHDSILSVVFADGRSLSWFRDYERFLDELRRVSRADSDTYAELFERFRPLAGPTLNMIPGAERAMIAASCDGQNPIALLAGVADMDLGRDILYYSLRPVSETINDFFVSPEARHLFRMMSCQLQTLPDDVFKLQNNFVLLQQGVHANWMPLGLAIGGTGSVCAAMKADLEAYGGEVRFGTWVESIDVGSNGEARGVTLADGTSYAADRAVVSNVNHVLTLIDMVGPEHLDPWLARKIRNWRWEETCLFSVHWALDERIVWNAAEQMPYIQTCPFVGVVPDDPDEFYRDMHLDNRAGRVPLGLGYQGVFPTVSDPTQAPPGKHTGLAWQPCTYELRPGGAERWDDVKDAYAQMLTEFTSRFTRNDFRRSVLAMTSQSPLDYERRNPSFVRGSICNGSTGQDQGNWNRPFHDHPMGRSPIPNLYLCGDFVGVTGVHGRHAAQLVCDDLGLERWWEKAAATAS